MKLLLISLILIKISLARQAGFLDDSESIECISEKCSCDSKSVIKCVNFESFSDLNFEYFTNKEIDVLDLKPSKPILLDDSLQLHSFRINKQVILRNLAGFSSKHNPFSDKNVNLNKDGLSVVELKLYDSEFEFYETQNVKLNFECTIESFSNRTTLLAKFSKIWLNENTKYSQSLCPLVFRGVNIDLFLAHQMNSKNRLRFRHMINITDVMKSKINYLSLINAKLDRLDSSLVDKDVFSNLKTFQLLGSLNEIQSDFFHSFKFIKSILFELFNFGDFIRKNSEWMAYLKYDSEFDKSSQRDVLIILNDKNKQFEYTDNDFCLFRHFPNDNFVYPVIKTKFNLTCSCTLFWMLKNWKLYKNKQGSNIIQTQSVDKCINNQSSFDSELQKCNFEKRISECNDTTAFTLKITTPGLVNFKLKPSVAPLPPLPLPPPPPSPSSASIDFIGDFESASTNNPTTTKQPSEKRRPTTRQFFFTTTTTYSNYYYLNPISIIDMAAGAISLIGFVVVMGVLGFILFT